MRFMRFLLFSTLGLALIVTAVDAQPRPATTPRPTVPAVTPSGAATVNDPVVQLRTQVTTLQSRMRGLESRVLTLEELVKRMDARTTFRCANDTTSQNGAGLVEDCGRYKCNPLDGRCRVSASDTSTCATGYLWVMGDHCLLPSEFPKDD